MTTSNISMLFIFVAPLWIIFPTVGCVTMKCFKRRDHQSPYTQAGQVGEGRGNCRRCVRLEHDHGLAQDEVLVHCGHCLKAAHQTLLMLTGVLALELIARRFEDLRARRFVVGRCVAWIARTPSLRAPSRRGRPAMRFGGLAWLAHRGDCAQGCAHRECIVRLQRAIGKICEGSAPSQHMQRAGTQIGQQRTAYWSAPL
jgi:hypothetical protein